MRIQLMLCNLASGHVAFFGDFFNHRQQFFDGFMIVREPGYLQLPIQPEKIVGRFRVRAPQPCAFGAIRVFQYRGLYLPGNQSTN